MVAEDLADEGTGLEGVDGLAEGARQADHAGLLALGGRHRVRVAGDLGLELEPLLDAADAGGDRDGQRQVGVGHRVGVAQLDAGRLVLARLVGRNADECRAVLAAPGGVDGDLAVGHEALVGVDRGVGHERELGGVLEDARDVRLGQRREVRVVVDLGRPEEVGALVVEDRLVEEHARAGEVGERLRHERREHVVGVGLLADDQARGHDVVGAALGLGEAQLDGVLRGGVGVVGVLHGNRHLLEHEGGLATEVGRDVTRREVEVAGAVERHRVGVVVEVEVLDLGADVGDVALGVRLAEDALEHRARVTVERLARRGLDVAEDAGDALLGGTPREDLEGGGVGECKHVRLLLGHEPLDGRAVEADALLEGLLEVLRRDGERLEPAQHIGKPQADEADAALLDGPQNEVDVPVAHARVLPQHSDGRCVPT